MLGEAFLFCTIFSQLRFFLVPFASSVLLCVARHIFVRSLWLIFGFHPFQNKSLRFEQTDCSFWPLALRLNVLKRNLKTFILEGFATVARSFVNDFNLQLQLSKLNCKRFLHQLHNLTVLVTWHLGLLSTWAVVSWLAPVLSLVYYTGTYKHKCTKAAGVDECIACLQWRHLRNCSTGNNKMTTSKKVLFIWPRCIRGAWFSSAFHVQREAMMKKKMGEVNKTSKYKYWNFEQQISNKRLLLMNFV